MIHPIAGKCKHCKADLTSYHAARPAANAPLPPLHPAPQANGHAHERATPHTAHAPAAQAVPVAAAATYDVAQPVLPPRPADRSYATEPTASGWRSWPVVVIVVATLAILVAVVLMAWPARGGRGDLEGKHTMAPSPAPDRMQTEPELKPPPQTDPVLPAPPQPRATHDPWDDPPAPPTPPPDPGTSGIDTEIHGGDLDGVTDPFASPHPMPGPMGRGQLKIDRHGMMMVAIAEHMCRKVLQCGADDPAVRSTCDAFSRTPAILPSCTAADRCLQRIDAMSCGSQRNSFLQPRALVAQFPDCAEAVRC